MRGNLAPVPATWFRLRVAPPARLGNIEEMEYKYSPRDIRFRHAAMPVVDVKERRGFWMQGGEGYIRFEGKCLKALEDRRRLSNLSSTMDRPRFSLPTHKIWKHPTYNPF